MALRSFHCDEHPDQYPQLNESISRFLFDFAVLNFSFASRYLLVALPTLHSGSFESHNFMSIHFECCEAAMKFDSLILFEGYRCYVVATMKSYRHAEAFQGISFALLLLRDDCGISLALASVESLRRNRNGRCFIDSPVFAFEQPHGERLRQWDSNQIIIHSVQGYPTTKTPHSIPTFCRNPSDEKLTDNQFGSNFKGKCLVCSSFGHKAQLHYNPLTKAFHRPESPKRVFRCVISHCLIHSRSN